MKVKKGFNHMKENGFAVSDILHTLAGPSLDSLDLVKLVQCAIIVHAPPASHQKK